MRKAWPLLDPNQKLTMARRAAFWGDAAALQWMLAAGGFGHDGGGLCSVAAWSGDVAVLQLARQHGFPWDGTTSRLAAHGGHLAVLQWARQHGCPWNREQCVLFALDRYDDDMRDWIRDRHEDEDRAWIPAPSEEHEEDEDEDGGDGGDEDSE